MKTSEIKIPGLYEQNKNKGCIYNFWRRVQKSPQTHRRKYKQSRNT